MNDTTRDERVNDIARISADLFVLDAWYIRGERIDLSLRYRVQPKLRAIRHLESRLKQAGYSFNVTPGSETVNLEILSGRKLRVPLLNIVLFLVTVASVYLIPASLLGWNLAAGEGIEFTVALMSILLVHEMGHFIASRRRGVYTSWPYFIPAPNLFGTFGAIITTKSPFHNRRDLIETGAAGPVAGWLVLIPWLIYGLGNSYLAPASVLPDVGITFSLNGESLLISWLVPLLVDTPGPGQMIVFSEAAFAAWVGLLVTALNMLPMSQLDGGHILFGLIGKRQKWFGWVTVVILAGLGFLSPAWWIVGALGLFIGLRVGMQHPPTLDDSKPLSTASIVLGIVSIVVLILSFTPIPMSY